MNTDIRYLTVRFFAAMFLLGLVLAGCSSPPGKTLEERVDLEIRSDGSGRLVEIATRVSKEGDKFSAEELDAIHKYIRDSEAKHTITEDVWTSEDVESFKSLADLKLSEMRSIELKTVKSGWFGLRTPVRRLTFTDFNTSQLGPEFEKMQEEMKQMKKEHPAEYREGLKGDSWFGGDYEVAYSMTVPGRIEQSSDLVLNSGNLIVRGMVEGSTVTWRVPRWQVIESFFTGEGLIELWVEFAGVMTAPDGKSKIEKEEPKPTEKTNENPTSEPAPGSENKTLPPPPKPTSQLNSRPPDVDGLLDEAQAAYDKKDFTSAFALYKEAAEQGNAKAQFSVGYMYTFGEGVAEDNREAVRWYRKAAEQGYAAAQNNLGVKFSKGEGVPKDDREAVRWYREAAEQGYALAQKNLGIKYAYGEGVPRDDREAVRWYRKAAEQGNAMAQNNLGYKYSKGEGVPRDDREAVSWYRKAAEQGHASAQYNLGIKYANGEGVPRDDREAVRWYRKAAEQGDTMAQNNLGYKYSKGEGVPKDDREAVRWYRKAAEQGNAVAQRNLGIKYANGEGIPKDNREAVRWFRKAAEQGDEPAKRMLREME